MQSPLSALTNPSFNRCFTPASGATGAARFPVHGVAHRRLPPAQADHSWPSFGEAIRTDWQSSAGGTSQYRIHLHKKELEKKRARKSMKKKWEGMQYRIRVARAHCEMRIQGYMLRARIPRKKIRKLKMKMKMYDEALEGMCNQAKIWKPIFYKEPAFSKIRSSKLKNEIV